MDILKIQQDILKHLYKSEYPKFVHYKQGDNVFVGCNGCVVYKIPQDKLYVGMDNGEYTRLKDLLDKEKDSERVLKATLYDEDIIHLQGEYRKAYIDEKLLKFFKDKKYKLSFKVVGLIDPVFVYNDDELLGFVMPLRVDESTLTNPREYK